MATSEIPVPATLEITTSRQLLSWLAEQKISIALTTYQIGKLYFIGLKPDNALSVFERSFNRCMGLCTTPNGLYMSSLYQIWRFENVFEPGQQQEGYDRLYVPQVGYTTGDLDIHDMAVDSHGRLVFVNTLFGCLAALSEAHSFKPLWQPAFISKLAAEDRCHLNGLAMRDGEPAYVTAVGRSDVADGCGVSILPTAVWSSVWILTRSCVPGCRCRILRVGITASYGCSIPVPGILAMSIRKRDSLSRFVFVPAICADSAFTVISP